MGTSTGYNAPTSPQWRQVKTEVTQSARVGSPSNNTARKILRDYISANGGARQMSRGGGVAGGSRAASSAARKFAGFVSSVSANGLQEALREIGLESLEGKPVEDIVYALTDYLGGSASTIDDADLRSAILDLNKELLEEAESFEDVEDVMKNLAEGDNLNQLLVKLFGYYLYQQFCRVFYERLVTRVGESKADQFIGGIKNYVLTALQHETSGREISRIDWNGEEGLAIAEKILEETLDIYSG